MMENPIKMDDLGVRFFLETPIYEDAIFFQPHKVVNPKEVMITNGIIQT